MMHVNLLAKETPGEAAERRRGYQRAYRARHLDDVRARSRASANRWYAENKEIGQTKSRAWRAANPEKAKAARAAWQPAHPERAAQNRDRWRAENPERTMEHGRASHMRCYRAQAARHMLLRAKRRAEAAGVPFSLSCADVSIPDVCPVLGIPIAVANGRHGHDSPSLDRLVPALGYVPGNVTVISNRTNMLKRDGSLAELVKLVEWMRARGAK